MKSVLWTRVKKITLIIGGILIFIFLLFFVFKLSKTRSKTFILQDQKGRFSDLVKKDLTPMPTVVIFTPTPTATPTLTLQQIAEIQRKQFEDLNQKYGPCKYVPILMYHHVMEAKVAKEIGASGLNVPPDIFRQQIDYLLGKGYQIIGLDDLFAGLATNSLPSKPVVLTFDDGYRDFYDYVFPILKEKNIKATVFLISQFTGGERYLVWAQAREMADSGLVLIGDHTLNHRSLPSVSAEEEKNQIVAAKQIIENYVGRKINFFAYPYGGTNQNARTILKENSFSAAVTTVQGRTQCLGLPYDWQRIRIGSAPLSRFGL